MSNTTERSTQDAGSTQPPNNPLLYKVEKELSPSCITVYHINCYNPLSVSF